MKICNVLLISVFLLTGFIGFIQGQEKMSIGTNFWPPWWGGGSCDPFPGRWGKYDPANPWRQEFLDELKMYSALRFMDWAGENGKERMESWASRTQPDEPQKPVAFEVMIDLCNKTGCDMWCVVPYLWDKDIEGMKNLAMLIKANLNENLKCYVEYFSA